MITEQTLEKLKTIAEKKGYSVKKNIEGKAIELGKGEKRIIFISFESDDYYNLGAMAWDRKEHSLRVANEMIKSLEMGWIKQKKSDVKFLHYWTIMK